MTTRGRIIIKIVLRSKRDIEMKTLLRISAFCAIQFSFIYGMGLPPAPPPPPPPFLSSEISGLPHQAPLFFADTNTVTILTQVSFFTPSSIDGDIKVEGTYKASVENQSEKDLKWNIPGSSFNLGMSFNAGNSWAFFMTVNIENSGNGLSADADLGASILISTNKNIRARLDLGLSSLSMNMKTKLGSNDSSYSIYTNNDKGWDPFISLTLNTAFDDWIINPFLQGSYCFQTLFNINWSEDVEIYSNINVLTITPGVTYRISKKILLVAGGSYFIPSQIENKSSPGIFSGFVQTNFLF